MMNYLKQILADRLNLWVYRDTDKMESEVRSTVNFAHMSGLSEDAVDQFLVEERKNLTTIRSAEEKRLETEVTDGDSQPEN